MRIMSKMNRLVAALIHRGRGPQRLVLLLTTTGRKSGLPRVTPLQFEEVGGDYYLGSARGTQADWYRNVQADPCVQIEVQGRKLSGVAEAVNDPSRVADFLAMRMERHPLMIGMITHIEGLPLRFSRADLERFSAGKALVIVRIERESPRSEARQK